MKELNLPHARVPLPAFFPDATYGAIRAGTFDDVRDSGSLIRLMVQATSL